jgi:thioesterase domain-containing protein/acyl carrier protein
MLIAADWAGASKGVSVHRPLKAISGGEALPRDLADALLSRGVELWNLYGPTETTIYSAFHRVMPGSGMVPIGRPIHNTTLYILDGDRHPVPVGVAGELYIGGVGVARGYRARPDLTAERFVPDPFSATPEAKIYRTGDIARYRADGVIEFLGRADHQVKIRGFRIELGDIEAALLRLPEVRSAVVVAQESAAGAQRLVAFVAEDPKQPVSVSVLASALRKSLPDYMVPAKFVVLPALPMTLNGKIDRRALPMPAWGQTESAQVAPVTQVEQDLAEIFAAVLSLPKVGATDSFFELGGDSLSAVALAIAVKKRFGRSITLAELFATPTVQALAVVLADQRQSPASRLMTLRTVGDKAPLICLPGSGGFSLRFRSLIDRLPADRKVYGYNIPTLEQRQSPMNSLRDYAVDVLAEIRRAYPTGPFHLLGYSFGGSLAFEIGRLQMERGETPAFIGMIDAWGPGYPFKLPMLPRMMLHLRNIVRGKPGARTIYLISRLKSLRGRVKRKWRRLNRALGIQGSPASAAQKAMDDILELAELSLRDYFPTPLARPVHLFRVESHPSDWPGCDFTDPYNGFGPYVAGKLTVTSLPCIHDDVFDASGVGTLAAALSPLLEAADENRHA